MLEYNHILSSNAPLLLNKEATVVVLFFSNGSTSSPPISRSNLIMTRLLVGFLPLVDIDNRALSVIVGSCAI